MAKVSKRDVYLPKENLSMRDYLLITDTEDNNKTKTTEIGNIATAVNATKFDQIITLGSITLDAGLRQYTFQDGWSWRINGVLHTPDSYTTPTLSEEPTGFSRTYVVVGLDNGTFELLIGDAVEGVSIARPVPPGTVYITKIEVNGSSIGEPEEPIVGSDDYKKIYLAEQRITEEVLEHPLPSDGRTNFVFTVGAFEMEGFTIPSGHEHLFAGKLFFLYNLSDDPITLKHNFGTAGILFNLSNEVDYVLAAKAKVIFQYSPVYGLQLVSGGSSETSAQKTQNNITFTNVNGDFFGTDAAPRTGALTIDTTGAVLGGNSCVFYNNATLNITPFPDLVIGTFVPDELNVIFILRSGGGFLIANILNSGEVSTIPGAPTSLTLTEGTFTETPFAPTSLTLTEGTI